jgi:predicted RNA-binding protein YlxR (DUF448 family)
MEAAHTSAPTEATELPAAMPEHAGANTRPNTRRCIATGEALPKDELIRFVVGPDSTLYPDLAQNLPGRGLWVSATREAISDAAKKNLFSKAAKTAVKVGPDLLLRVTQLMHKRCLDFLGLARRSGIAVLGQPQVEGELKARKLGLILLADDAGSDLSAFRDIKDIFISRRFTRNELGAALGHEQLVYIGLKPNNLTGMLKAELTKLAQLENSADTHHMDTEQGITG